MCVCPCVCAVVDASRTLLLFRGVTWNLAGITLHNPRTFQERKRPLVLSNVPSIGFSVQSSIPTCTTQGDSRAATFTPSAFAQSDSAKFRSVPFSSALYCTRVVNVCLSLFSGSLKPPCDTGIVDRSVLMMKGGLADQYLAVVFEVSPTFKVTATKLFDPSHP